MKNIIRKHYENKYPRKENERMWKYNRRISRHIKHDVCEVVATTIMGIVVAGVLIAILLFGDDGQCHYEQCSCGVEGYPYAYHCVEHGHDCDQND